MTNGSYRATRWTAKIAVVLLLLGTAVLAEDPPKKEEEKKEESPAYTNEDLQERYGTPEPAKPASPPAGEEAKPVKPTDPKQPAAEPMGPAEKAKRRAAIETELDRLRKRLASLHNPFLPRVKPTEEEKEREKTMDNAARVREVEARIQKLETELKKLE